MFFKTEIIYVIYHIFIIKCVIEKGFSNSNQKQEVFGMVGIASLGPIIVMLIIFAILGNNGTSMSESLGMINIFLSILKQSYLTILPLTLIFFIYDLFYG